MDMNQLIEIVYNLSMEDKMMTINVSQLEKITSRRSRKDQQGRDYQCGCGKRYLSYPALYTHIKTKHEGRQPEGTQKTGINQTAKKTKGKLDEQTLKSIYSYFDKEELRIFSQLQESLLGSIPLNSRIKKDIVPIQVYECYVSLIKQQQVKLSNYSPLQLALTIFLINIGERVNDKVYQQFVLFSKIAKNSFVEHGEQVYRAYFAKKDLGPFYLHTFSVNQVKYFPIISDFIIQSYIPYTYAKEGKQINISLMELLTYDFCNWLYINKLTPIKISLSKNYRLDYKPVLTKQKITPNKSDHKEKQISYNFSNSKEIRQNEDSEQASQNEDLYDDELADYEQKKQNLDNKQQEV